MNHFTFDPIADPFGVIIPISLVIVIILIYLEVKRANKKHLIARLLSALVVCMSLIMMALRPSYSSLESDKNAVIITIEYPQQKLDSLKKLKYDLILYDTLNLLGGKPFTRYISENYSALHILGSGLRKNEIESIHNTKVFYYPPSPSKNVSVNGVSALSKPIINRENSVFLEVYNGIEDSVSVTLSFAANQVDSATITHGHHGIVLNYVPATVGFFDLSIGVKDVSGRHLLHEYYPVMVRKEVSPRVLLLSGFPTYEFKYLYQYLGNGGYPVASIIDIGKNNISASFRNMERQNLKFITADKLYWYDILIVSSGYLNGLSDNQLSKFERAVSEGVGLIVYMDDIPVDRFPFDIVDIELSKSEGEVKLDEINSSVNAPNTAKPSIKFFPVQQDIEGNILSGYFIKDQGKVGIFLPRELYALQLSGEENIYSLMFDELIESVRKRSDMIIIKTSDKLPVLGNEVGVDLLNYNPILDGTSSIIVSNEHDNSSVNLELRQDVLQENHWNTRFYPQKPGWHKASLSNDSSLVDFFYVYDSTEWKGPRLAKRMESNYRAAKRSSYEAKSKEVTNPVSSWLWLSLFVIAAGYLWLEPKL